MGNEQDITQRNIRNTEALIHLHRFGYCYAFGIVGESVKEACLCVWCLAGGHELTKNISDQILRHEDMNLFYGEEEKWVL